MWHREVSLATWTAFVCWLLLQCVTVNTEITSKETVETKLKTTWNDSQKKLKVLILTIPLLGHTTIPLALGEELVRRGHSVTLSTSGSKYKEKIERLGIEFLSTGLSHDAAKIAGDHQMYGTLEATVKFVQGLREMLAIETNQFYKLIETKTKQGTKWDIVIGTNVLVGFLPCIRDYLDIPALVASSITQAYPHTYPPWPWPSTLSGGTNDDMTFLERFGNAIERMFIPHVLSFMFLSPVQNLTDRICPDVTATVMSSAPAVYLPELVPTVIGFEFPRVITPLTHYVGPMLPHTTEPCSAELKEWLDGKKDNSVIYISMGSLQKVSREQADMFVEGIKKTNFSVVWAIKKTDDYELDLDPDRFYLNKWLPQLSVLRHRATGMAITHGGANGVHESLHSGVPLIVIPSITEQIATSGRVHNHRLGIHLNRNTLTADQIANSILEIDSGDYRENVRTIQKMFAQAGGVERAADLVEFYTEVGYDHLIPAYAKYQWSWVQYYNADVYTILLVCAVITVYLWFRVIKCVCSRCCGSKKPKID